MSEKKRMANLDLLRCIAMMMIVVLHYLGKGNLLPDTKVNVIPNSIGLNSIGVVAWLMESFCIVAVNVYMLISGYFLCTSNFKLTRLLQLWFQLWFYSVIVGVICAMTGLVNETPVDTHYYLTLLFPVTMGHYWFMTAYIFLYVMIPFLTIAIRKMSEKQLRVSVFVLLLVFCVSKSVVPFRMELDQKGYDCLWYLCVFVTAAYIRRFGLIAKSEDKIKKEKSVGICLYFAGVLLAFAGTLALRFLYFRTGSLQRMVGMCLEYNHIFPFIAAVGLFLFFKNIQVPEKLGTGISRISAYTLGVYLLHENLGLRYSWQNWFGAGKVASMGSLILTTIVAAVVVFACGILIDFVRSILEKIAVDVLGKVQPGKWIISKIKEVDDCFRQN